MLSGAYRFPAMESVVFGKAYTEALAQDAIGGLKDALKK